MTHTLVLCVLALQQTPANRTVEFTGTVVMNAFFNSARTNNSDVPVVADTDATGITGGSATMRQTRYQAGDFTASHFNLAAGFHF